ncbi:hypothetical protein AGMMS49949_03800 [Alphaproteobacteria bacterium]|nr:hypothetical protein AGMMS49949_03800 [Alphaproteobacteria bacterium]GHS96609.1 hypothetical protein AGMMS50296_2940 [Alphaproteobacteria bacterium]
MFGLMRDKDKPEKQEEGEGEETKVIYGKREVLLDIVDGILDFLL